MRECTEKDNGLYILKLRNDFGATSVAFVIEIPPFIEQPPKLEQGLAYNVSVSFHKYSIRIPTLFHVTFDSTMQAIQESDKAELICTLANRVPDAEVTWYK